MLGHKMAVLMHILQSSEVLPVHALLRCATAKGTMAPLHASPLPIITCCVPTGPTTTACARLGLVRRDAAAEAAQPHGAAALLQSLTTFLLLLLQVVQGWHAGLVQQAQPLAQQEPEAVPQDPVEQWALVLHDRSALCMT